MSRPLMKPDNNIVLLDAHRGADTSEVRFPPGGCCTDAKPNPYLMMALLFFAKRVIKAHWKAQGIRVEYCSPGDIRRAAEQYLTEHWRDFLPQAQRLVDRVAAKKAERSNVTSAARRKQRSNPSTIPVQKSGAK